KKTVFSVGGVFKKTETSSIKTKALLFNVQLVSQHLNPSISNDELGNAGGVILFIQTKPGTDFASKSDDLYTYFKDFFWIYKLDVCKEVKIIPLKDIYFSQIKATNHLLLQGDKQFVLILSGVALFILLFALINYINLTVAQTGFRAKEMAMRRLLGSSKTADIIRFISEAIVLTLIAFVIALFFCESFKPFTMRLLGKEVAIFYGITTVEILVCFALIVIIGFFAGIIPAIMISRYKPIDVVKGTFRFQSKMVLGKVFVVIQNIVTITMLALTLALFLQIKHLINRPLGYKTENIMNVDIPSQFSYLHSNDSTSSAMNMLKNELEQLPNVKRVGFARGNPCANSENQTFQYGDDIISLMKIGLDTAAFSILGFEVISQNSDQLGDNWWLTEGAMRDLKADYDATELVLGTESNNKINGVIKDFIPLWTPVEENTFVLFTITSKPWNIILETTGNQAKARVAVKEKMQQITQSEINLWYSSDMIDKRYEDQRNILNIVLIFTIITIIISTLGLIAMSTYYTRQRSMEVAVRKVFGSSSWEMFTRLTSNFLKLLIISFVIALPIAWFLIDYWLKDYSYRINISPLIFVVAGFATLLIAAAAISWQSARAANANPVETVKKQQQ
ncbi:MAG: FtsX-like permease family protein, partial [Bacteroidales bacterium]|nr:FtsX-like permease family protein [Bacteroidales bacterium]